jgi:hypothetical protein
MLSLGKQILQLIRMSILLKNKVKEKQQNLKTKQNKTKQSYYVILVVGNKFHNFSVQS